MAREADFTGDKNYIAWAGCCVLRNYLIGREVVAVRANVSGKESYRHNIDTLLVNY